MSLNLVGGYIQEELFGNKNGKDGIYNSEEIIFGDGVEDNSWKIVRSIEDNKYYLEYYRLQSGLWVLQTTLGGSVISDSFILNRPDSTIGFIKNNGETRLIIKPSTDRNGVVQGNAYGRMGTISNGSWLYAYPTLEAPLIENRVDWDGVSFTTENSNIITRSIVVLDNGINSSYDFYSEKDMDDFRFFISCSSGESVLIESRSSNSFDMGVDKHPIVAGWNTVELKYPLPLLRGTSICINLQTKEPNKYGTDIEGSIAYRVHYRRLNINNVMSYPKWEANHEYLRDEVISMDILDSNFDNQVSGLYISKSSHISKNTFSDELSDGVWSKVLPYKSKIQSVNKNQVVDIDRNLNDNTMYFSINDVDELKISNQGLFLPIKSQTEINMMELNTLEERLMVYNSTTKEINYFNGSTWISTLSEGTLIYKGGITIEDFNILSSGNSGDMYKFINDGVINGAVSVQSGDTVILSNSIVSVITENDYDLFYSSVSQSYISNSDNDTKIETEKFLNDKNIRFTVNSIENAVLSQEQFYPFSNNYMKLGSPSNSWESIYLSNSIHSNSNNFFMKFEYENFNRMDFGTTQTTIKSPNKDTYIELREDNIAFSNAAIPLTDNSISLGSISNWWKNCYLKGFIHTDNLFVIKNKDNKIRFGYNNDTTMFLSPNNAYSVEVNNFGIYSRGGFFPKIQSIYDIGSAVLSWKNLYMNGSIMSSGTFSISNSDATRLQISDTSTKLYSPNGDYVFEVRNEGIFNNSELISFEKKSLLQVGILNEVYYCKNSKIPYDLNIFSRGSKITNNNGEFTLEKGSYVLSGNINNTASNQDIGLRWYQGDNPIGGTTRINTGNLFSKTTGGTMCTLVIDVEETKTFNLRVICGPDTMSLRGASNCFGSPCVIIKEV